MDFLGYVLCGNKIMDRDRDLLTVKPSGWRYCMNHYQDTAGPRELFNYPVNREDVFWRTSVGTYEGS